MRSASPDSGFVPNVMDEVVKMPEVLGGGLGQDVTRR